MQASLSSLRNGSRSCWWLACPATPMAPNTSSPGRSRRFARRLESRFGIETVLVDERYTSVTASAALREAGVNGNKQKHMLDQVAAQLILQTYFDGRDATT